MKCLILNSKRLIIHNDFQDRNENNVSVLSLITFSFRPVKNERIPMFCSQSNTYRIQNWINSNNAVLGTPSTMRFRACALHSSSKSFLVWCRIWNRVCIVETCRDLCKKNQSSVSKDFIMDVDQIWALSFLFCFLVLLTIADVSIRFRRFLREMGLIFVISWRRMNISNLMTLIDEHVGQKI